MSEIHLKHPGSTYSACGLFTKRKNTKILKKWRFKTYWIYESDKAFFQHDMAYGNFKDLSIRTSSDKVLQDKAFNIAKNPKHDGYQKDLTCMVYNILIKNHLVE